MHFLSYTCALHVYTSLACGYSLHHHCMRKGHKGDHLMKMRLVSYARSQFMRSEKSKVLGALLPSESYHDEFEALYLQYSYDMAHTFYLALYLASRLFLVFE